MPTLLSVSLTIVLGALGWFVLEFFGRPIRKFFDLRREVRRLMLRHSSTMHAQDAYTMPPDERVEAYKMLEAPREEFAELAAQMTSFDQSESLAAWTVRRLRFDASVAGKALRKIGLELGTAHEDREKALRQLDTALRFRVKQGLHFHNPWL